MTKYIELEALKNRFAKRLVWLKKDIHDEYSLGLYDGCEYDTKLIDEIPAADVVPVRHGRWEKQNGLYSCSECGKTCPYDVQADVIEYWACNYCPNCGCRIDGGDNNANKEIG